MEGHLVMLETILVQLLVIRDLQGMELVPALLVDFGEATTLSRGVVGVFEARGHGVPVRVAASNKRSKSGRIIGTIHRSTTMSWRCGSGLG